MSEFLRPFETRDLDELVRLCQEHAEYERAPWVERDDRVLALESLLRAEDAWCWVIESGASNEVKAELGGFATVFLERSTWDAGRFLHLDCLYLRPAYRGRGIGQRLMAEAAKTAHELGAISLQWQTPVWNEGAARFYRRLGASAAEKLRFTLSREQIARVAQTG